MGAAVELTWAQALAWRWEACGLAVRGTDPLAVASRSLGLHAQLWASAGLTLAARCEGVTAALLDELVWEQRALVKTWGPRGTLHLLPAEELGFWVAAQALLPPRYDDNAWLRRWGRGRDEAVAMFEAIDAALSTRPITRAELADAVAATVGSADLADLLRGGFGDLLKPAAFRGSLVFGPNAGRNVTFVHPGEVAPFVGDPADALVRRYLAAYGPATREELARWFGMKSAAMAGLWIAALGDDVVAVGVDGTARWALAETLDALVAAQPRGIVRLLPAFDQWVVTAPRDEDAVITAATKDAVYRQQGWLSPVVARDGVVLGTWTREDGDVDVQWFGKDRPDLGDEPERIAAYDA